MLRIVSQKLVLSVTLYMKCSVSLSTCICIQMTISRLYDSEKEDLVLTRVTVTTEVTVWWGTSRYLNDVSLTAAKRMKPNLVRVSASRQHSKRKETRGEKEKETDTEEGEQLLTPRIHVSLSFGPFRPFH